MMRVLLTGGSGFIGRHVRQELVANGHDPIVIDVQRPDADVDASATDHVIADVRDSAALDRILPGVDAVCHLAAKVGLGVNVQDLPDYAASNVHATSVLLAAMARAGVSRLVLASSMVVYGEGLGRCAQHGDVAPTARREADLRAGRYEPHCPRCGSPLRPALVDEDAPLDPRNAYAASKVGQEHFAASWARATGGSVAALRYHNVYGPGMPRNTPYAGVAAIFRSAIADGRPPLVFEDGGQRRDFVHVRDVATATVSALEQHVSGTIALNVGSGMPRTVGDLAVALAATAGGPAPQITGDYRLGDVRHITADSSRLRRSFNWRPIVDFTSGIAELMR